MSTDRCPVCEEKNACAMAATGDPTRPCWCRTARVPKGLLDGLPLADRGTRCVCERCIEAYDASVSTSR